MTKKKKQAKVRTWKTLKINRFEMRPKEEIDFLLTKIEITIEELQKCAKSILTITKDLNKTIKRK